MPLDPRAALFRSLGLFPLQPDDPAYVPCESVRGDMDVLRELGDTIVLSGEEEGYTCQLYTGARGSGKSTELLRLRQYLEAQGYFAVYFEADKGDIEIDDTEHTDILLACTRHIIEDLKELADAQPLLGWLKDRLDSLVELGLTEVELEKVGVEFQLPQFVKLMTNFKSLPNLRADVRKKIDLYTPSLVEILNKFINQAKSKLPEQYFQGEIVVIVDNLDRMVLQTDGQHSNYERIFIDRKNLMQGLHCHLIYTIPISMKYAPYSPTLAEDYDQLVMLPMIMIRNQQGEPHQAGLEILKEMVRRRLERSQVLIELENLFESSDALEILCRKSGGYVRNLVQLMQSAVKRSKLLPIADREVNIRPVGK
ncbi:MAG: ATP-binding protein [Microcystaceae cyanobacterium]